MANFEQTNQVIRKLKTLQKNINLRDLKGTLKKIDAKVALLVAIPIVVVIFIVFSIVNLISKSSVTSNAQTAPSTKIAKPLGTATINKEFTFALKDINGKTVGDFSYTLQNAELDKEIVVKGSRATAIAGRIFLVVNLKLINTEDRGLQVNTRDYVRLSVNGNTKELLAPEIHNDPVEVQADSTKYSRIGFAINESDKNFVLTIGEIGGKKQNIALSFTR